LKLERQTESDLSPKEANKIIKGKLLEELSFLEKIKKVMSTPEGRDVLIWIIQIKSDPLSIEYKNSGRDSYNKGMQRVGLEIIKQIIAAGCKLEITDICNTYDPDRINSIVGSLHNLEETKDERTNTND
jgi:hypothetical protein